MSPAKERLELEQRVPFEEWKAHGFPDRWRLLSPEDQKRYHELGQQMTGLFHGEQ